MHTELSEEFGQSVTARDRHHRTRDRGQRRRGRARLDGRAEFGFSRGVLVGHLLEEIGHADLARTATEEERRLDGRTDVVRVDVAVVEALSTDHDDRVADRSPRGLEVVGPRVVEVEKEHHLVAQFAHVDRAVLVVAHRHRLELLDRRSGRFIGLGHGLAVENVDERIEEEQVPGTTGVDHARILQDREEFGCPGECLTSRVARSPEHGDEVGTAVGGGTGALGRLAHHGEDGPLDRLQHRFVRRGCGLGECRGRANGVGTRRSGLGQRRGQSAQDLAEDDTAVAACTHERPVTHRLASGLHVRCRAVELGDHRVERARHVGSGVPVGHRVHVQTVDRRRMGLHGVAERHDRAPELAGSQHCHPCHAGEASKGTVSDGETARPGSAPARSDPSEPGSGTLGPHSPRW